MGIQFLDDVGFQHLDLVFPGGGFDFDEEFATFNSEGFRGFGNAGTDDFFPEYDCTFFLDAFVQTLGMQDVVEDIF